MTTRMYDAWVVVDPSEKTWFKVEADTLQAAAETAALTYDSRPDVDYALSKEGTMVQVVVRDPLDDSYVYSFDISCTLNPFYEITGPSARLLL